MKKNVEKHRGFINSPLSAVSWEPCKAFNRKSVENNEDSSIHLSRLSLGSPVKPSTGKVWKNTEDSSIHLFRLSLGVLVQDAAKSDESPAFSTLFLPKACGSLEGRAERDESMNSQCFPNFSCQRLAGASKAEPKDE